MKLLIVYYNLRNEANFDTIKILLGKEEKTMRKYEEKRYQFENIKDKIYPWVKEALIDHEALNGKYISPKDTPLVSFVGDLMIVFVIERGEDKYEILKDNMLPPDANIEEIYHLSCQNLVRDIKFVISNTLYGGFGIIADGHHEASSLCFKHIWTLCAEKLQDDLVIMVPAKDMVLFVPAGNQNQIKAMYEYGVQAYDRNKDKISKKLLKFTKETKELVLYEA